jgi:hypothetical protein
VNKHLVKPEVQGWYDNVMSAVYSKDLSLQKRRAGAALRLSGCAHAEGAAAFTPGSCLRPELSGRRQADLVTERSKARIVFELQREGVA